MEKVLNGYLGDLLSKESNFSWNRFLAVCAFNSLVGFSGMFGIAAPILGVIKMIDYILTLNIPYVENIRIVLGGIVEFNPIVEFIASLIIGVLIFWMGRGAWKLLVMYCKKQAKL